MRLAFSALYGLLVSCLTVGSWALVMGGRPDMVIKPYKRAPLQDIVGFPLN
jgi:hypothetical protein